MLGYIIAGVMSTGFPRLKSQLVAGVVLVAAFAPALAAYTSTQLSVTVIMLMAAGTGVGIGEVICVVGATSVVDVREFGAAAGAFWIAKRIGTSIASTYLLTSGRAFTNIACCSCDLHRNCRHSIS